MLFYRYLLHVYSMKAKHKWNEKYILYHISVEKPFCSNTSESMATDSVDDDKESYEDDVNGGNLFPVSLEIVDDTGFAWLTVIA